MPHASCFRPRPRLWPQHTGFVKSGTMAPSVGGPSAMKKRWALFFDLKRKLVGKATPSLWDKRQSWDTLLLLLCSEQSTLGTLRGLVHGAATLHSHCMDPRWRSQAVLARGRTSLGLLFAWTFTSSNPIPITAISDHLDPARSLHCRNWGPSCNWVKGAKETIQEGSASILSKLPKTFPPFYLPGA